MPEDDEVELDYDKSEQSDYAQLVVGLVTDLSNNSKDNAATLHAQYMCRYALSDFYEVPPANGWL